MRALVAGWFSFEEMGATAGDLLARDLACGWLEGAGVEYDVALAPPFAGGVGWREVDPSRYSHVVFVCGPFGNGWPVTDFLARFAGSKLVGLNVSILESLDRWNPFDALFERDSSDAARPDVSFLSTAPLVPVVGVVLVHPQGEYEDGMHDVAVQAIRRLVGSRELAAIEIDTRLDVNEHGLRTPAEVESLIARMDAVVTTRLHGLVLALKNGVPALAVDPIKGGAKVKRQAETIGWSTCLTADALADTELERALDWCLTESAREEARACAVRAQEMLRNLPTEFETAIHGR
jgi:hypothetical protein